MKATIRSPISQKKCINSEELSDLELDLMFNTDMTASEFLR
jgi:hypothetical protein